MSEKNKTKQYAQRDIESLDGYMTHVMAITAEKLHSKSDIAGELAWRDSQIAALQQKLDAMAAESAALKQVAMDYANLADSRLSEMTANCESDCRRECYEFTNKLPATDAYLNSVRAEGAMAARNHIRKTLTAFHYEHHGVVAECADMAEMVAQRLRSSTHDTADKAGAK